MFPAQLFAQALTDPDQQVIALAEQLQGQQPGRGGLGDGPGELLHGLHDVRQTLRGGIAQPAGQMFFQQQCITRGQGMLATHEAQQVLLVGQHGAEICRGGCLLMLPGGLPGNCQALTLHIDQVLSLLLDHVLGKPLVTQLVRLLDQLLVFSARQQLQHGLALQRVVEALAQLGVQLGEVGEGLDAM
ncbi:hypothetical protein D9M71_213750 [compost metagenome]